MATCSACHHSLLLGSYKDENSRVFVVSMRRIVPVWIRAYTSGQSLIKGVFHMYERKVTEVVVKNGKRSLERDLPFTPLHT